METQRVRGVELRGEEPKRLALSDGSGLVLDCESTRDGRVQWKRLGERRPCAGTKRISVAEAMELAGEEYAWYVAVRTRAEAEWMREVGSWYGREAEELSRQLEGARSRI
jgi:hypothetical protein